jgi:hypothetical protein
MDSSRNKAIEFLKGKGITSPETIVAKLDDIGLDKIDSLVDGDIKVSVGNFFEEHLKQFTDIVPAWIHSTLPGKKRKADSQFILDTIQCRAASSDHGNQKTKVGTVLLTCTCGSRALSYCDRYRR